VNNDCFAADILGGTSMIIEVRASKEKKYVDISLMSNYNREVNKARPSESVVSEMSKKLRAAYAVIRSEMQSRGLRGLDVSHGDILFVLMHKGPQPMSELSKRIDRDKSTVTSLVAKLEALGFVSRVMDPGDKRSFVIGLTARGEELKSDFTEISAVMLDRFWKGIARRERETFMEILSRISG
jgi:DNA-binding MarR family transcriptional regulator